MAVDYLKAAETERNKRIVARSRFSVIKTALQTQSTAGLSTEEYTLAVDILNGGDWKRFVPLVCGSPTILNAIGALPPRSNEASDAVDDDDIDTAVGDAWVQVAGVAPT